MFLSAYVRFGLIALLGLTAFAYWTGLSGDYLFDDRANILDNDSFKFSALTWDALRQILASGDAGTFKRPISMASFALNVATTGFDPFYFKLTNLVIHLVNGLLVFVFATRVAQAVNMRTSSILSGDPRAVGLLTSAIWLLHPLNLTSVLYVVQRMNSLAALFTILALVFFMVGRMRLVEGRPGAWTLCTVGVIVPAVLGLLSKENAILIPVFMLVLEFTVFRLRTSFVQDRNRLIQYYAVILGVPVVCAFAVVLWRPDFFLQGYDLRNFTLSERLMTQCRVVAYYLRLILVPDNREMGLYHDDIVTSHTFFDPSTTIVALVFLATLLYVAIHSAATNLWISFAILWFFGGHLLESTFIPLEMVHEHRNYVPSIGVIILFAHFLTCRWKGILAWLMPSTAVLLVILLTFVTHERAFSWRSLIANAETEAENHPESGRANLQMGRIYAMLMDTEKKPSYFQKAADYFWKAANSDGLPGYVGLLRLNYLAGRELNPLITTRIIQTVAAGNQAPAIPTLIQNISNCNLFEYCSLPDGDMLKIFEALRSNPSATQTAKSIVALVEAQYLYDKIGDRVAATRLLEELVAANPKNLNAVRNLVRVYRLAGRASLALEHLASGRKNDKYGEMIREFDAEAKLLSKNSMVEPAEPSRRSER